MIVDTSAVIAVLRGELDADRHSGALSTATVARMSAATFVETAVVVDSQRDPVLSGCLDDLVTAVPISVGPLTKRQAELARQAYRDFGKSRGHPARLDLGDCFACALARDTGEALLFTGGDSCQTDVRMALEP